MSKLTFPPFNSVFIVILLAPFLIMFGLGVTKINPHDWLARPSAPFSELDWGLFITTIVWNTGGFDNMSQVAGELKNPNKAYPRAMMIVLVAMIATYILPILVGVSIATDYSKWTEGYFPDVAYMVRPLFVPLIIANPRCRSVVNGSKF